MKTRDGVVGKLGRPAEPELAVKSNALAGDNAQVVFRGHRKHNVAQMIAAPGRIHNRHRGIIEAVFAKQ